MRNTQNFTDGRIHVTLMDGAFDVRAMSQVDRGLYGWLLQSWRAGMDLASFEASVDVTRGSSSIMFRTHYSEPLATLYQDLCRRIALEEAGANALLDEMVPWHPERSRELFESATNGYQPVALAFETRLAA